MSKYKPDWDEVYPIKMPQGTSKEHVFLKNIITNPNIIVGEYTFYHDFFDPFNFEKKNAGYFPKEMPAKLIIGKYCSIAHGAQFLSSATNHHMDGFSTYPFAAIWGESSGYDYYYPEKGDTVIGNDVWIGCEAVVMPGVKIGDGAIIGTRAIVTKDVLPYTIVAGNPACPIRRRFEQKIVDQLLEIQWWNWPHEVVVEHAKAIVGRDLEILRKVKRTLLGF